MKRIICLLMVVIISMASYGQAPGWAWAKTTNNNSFNDNDVSNSIVVDGNGNTYITGSFGGPSISFDNITLTSPNSGGIIIAKYDASGNIIWAKTNSDGHNVNGKGIAIDGNGNVYVAGQFNGGMIEFGGVTAINQNVPSVEIFLVKYDSFGTALWVKSIGGADIDFVNSIAVDNTGNSYIIGQFSSSSITFDNIVLTDSLGDVPVFIAKYDQSGSAVWAKKSSVSNPNFGSSNAGNSIGIDANGNAYMTGFFSCPSIIFGNTTLVNSSNFLKDFFIAKYDSSGNLIWAKSAGGTDSDVGTSVAVSANGNAYVTGNFRSGSINFGSFTLTDSVNGYSNVFVVRFDSSGNTVWAKGVNTANNFSTSISIDNAGYAYVTGNFANSSINFDTLIIYNSGGLEDFFIAKYDLSGNAIWATDIGGDKDDIANGIAKSTVGDLYLTGYYSSKSLIFGTNTLTNDSIGFFNLFVSKMNSVTGIAEQLNSSNPITLYPNPTTSQLTITNPYLIDKIEITDVLGQLIYQAAPHDKNCKAEIKHEGIYFITVATAEGRVTKKVVVE